jgi:hypothetical protein
MTCKVAFDRIIPPELFDRAASRAVELEKRKRKLPLADVARVLVGMGLFRDRGVAAVLDKLPGLGCAVAWGASERPHSTSVTQARDRLGVDAVLQLFREHAKLQSVQHRFDAWKDFDAVSAVEARR